MENLKRLGVVLLILSTYLSAVVYEDAEDMDTVGWSVYAGESSGATISNVFDSDRNSYVINLDGMGTEQGYMLGGLRDNRWNNTTEKIIEWSMNYAEDFAIYIAVQTTKGSRYLKYTNVDSDQGLIRSGSTHHGLGADSADGTWQTFTRDLEADLQEFDSDNSIIAVNAFMIRGSGKVDDIHTVETSKTLYEDAEDMDTFGWRVYAGESLGATISNVFDSDQDSYVIKFDGTGLENGYMLGGLRSGRWNNTTEKTVEWSMNYAEDFMIYIAVQTTKGSRYLQYTNVDSDQGLIRSGSTHHGLGVSSADGTWQTFTRDLEADLQEFDSDNSIIAVNAFMIRGSGKVDDISLSRGTASSVPDTTMPTIVLVGADEVNVTKGSVYTDAGAIASDNVDGDITADINVTSNVDTGLEGTYFVKYNVKDASGNQALEEIRKVNVTTSSSSTAPVITLNGESVVSLSEGSIYVDAGANVSGTISGSMTTDNPVDVTVPGIYEVTYSVFDRDGNEFILTREVHILPVINGRVFLSGVENAEINVTKPDMSIIGTGMTNSYGEYNITLTEIYNGPLAVLSFGGTYVSEANLSVTERAGNLCAIVDSFSSDTPVIVSAFTTFSCSYVGTEVDNGRDLLSALTEADSRLATIFGFASGTDFETLDPRLTKVGFNAGTASATAGFIAGTFERMADRVGLEPKVLYAMMALDFSDGVFDGKDANGDPIPGKTYSTYTDLLSAIDDFIKEAESNSLGKEGISRAEVEASTIKSKVVTALIAGAPSSSGLNIGSSGAVATLSYGGKQYVYVAGRAKGLVVADVTNPDSPSLIDFSALNTPLATAMGTYGIDISGVVAVSGLSQHIVVVYSYSSKKIVLVDVDTKTIVRTIDVPIPSKTSFSGGSAYISSAIFDRSRSGIWLATYDGYRFVNTSTGAVSATPIAIANSEKITENIGGDVSTNMLFSANYGTSYNGGVQWVDLIKNQAYSLDSSEYASISRQIFDAGSVDSNYHVGIMAPEDRAVMFFMDLNKSKYTFDDLTATFSSVGATPAIVEYNMVGSAGGRVTLSQAVIDSSRHLVLMMAGYSGDIAVAKLNDTSVVDALGQWIPISKRTYTRSAYSYARDPHAAGIVSNLNGKSYGYLLDSRGSILQVDMQAFLDAPVNDSTGVSYDSYRLTTSPMDGVIIQTLPIP